MKCFSWRTLLDFRMFKTIIIKPNLFHIYKQNLTFALPAKISNFFENIKKAKCVFEASKKRCTTFNNVQNLMFLTITQIPGPKFDKNVHFTNFLNVR